MAILKSKSGYSFDTETGIRTNPDNTQIRIDKTTGKTIPVSSLDTNNETVLPNMKTETVTQPILTPLETEEKKIQDKATQSDTDYRNLLEQIGVVEGKELEYADELGATENRLLYKDYENKLNAEKRALELETRRLQENPEGMSVGGLRSTIDDIERKSLHKLS